LSRILGIGLYFGMFLLGLGYTLSASIIISGIFSLKLSLGTRNIVSRDSIIGLFILLLFSLTLYPLGLGNMDVGNPLKSFMVVIFYLLVILPIFLLENRKNVVLYDAYIFGYLIFGYLCTYGSMYKDSIYYGYGKLWNPITGSEINSSNVNVVLAVTLVYFSTKNYLKSSRIIGIGYVLVIALLSTVAAIYTGGRFYFLALGLVVVFFLSKIKKLSFIHLSYLGFFIIAVFTQSSWLIENMHRQIDLFTTRMESGLESNRFELWSYALEMIPYSPFGGFSPHDMNFEATSSFHNVFLDAARIGGWLPLLLLISYFIYALVGLYAEGKKIDAGNKLTLFLSFMAMQQAVVFEGDIKMFFSFVLLAVVNGSKV